MRTRVSVVILRNKHALLMHRLRDGEEYYVLPGGGVEGEETTEAAAIREAKEETNLDIKLGRKILDSQSSSERNIVFLVDSFSGTPKLTASSPEAKRQNQSNQYQLEWVNITDLDAIKLVPTTVRGDLKRL